jgi:hypothetical protein
MSIQPSLRKCPQCLQQNSENACQHAFPPAENTRVHEPAVSSSGAEVRDRELPLHVTCEADTAAHIETKLCEAEADSDSESNQDCMSHSDTSDDTDCTDDTDRTDDIDDTINGTESDNHERYDAYYDSSESLSSIEHPEGGLSSYPFSAFDDISVT